MRNITVITGQTATGKTSYALKLAKEQNGELVNFDSRQLYKYLDIITGKDIPRGCHFEPYVNEERNLISNTTIGHYTIDGIRLWLYDVIDPKFLFSSFDYKELAHVVIDDIVSRNKIPIFVGGSYLYIKHLLYGFETESIPPDWQLREQLKDTSVADLAQMLQSINIQMFKQLNNSDNKNPQRLIRKIEISSHDSSKQRPKIGLAHKTLGFEGKLTPGVSFISMTGFRYGNTDRLGEIIRQRVAERLEMGAIEEVENLLRRGYAKNDSGLNTIGYKEIVSHLEGKLTKQETIERWILSEIQYAKRQLTFMKKDTNITWKLV